MAPRVKKEAATATRALRKRSRHETIIALRIS
jgi:hypothetical protein